MGLPIRGGGLKEMAKIAFIFPGQGSQEVGMGSDFHDHFDKAKALFDTANHILGYDLSRLCFEGPEEELRLTIHTQPALYVTSCVALAVLSDRIALKPYAYAGHSVGEYSALHAAGALSFETGLKLVQKRAELMQEATVSRPGGMAAIIGMDADEVKEICRVSRSEGIIAVANFNCPGQTVISGETEALQAACEMAKSKGAKRVLPLSVSGAFHSPLMANSGDALYPYLRDAHFKNTVAPVVVNVTAEYCTSGVDFAPYLTMQLSGSVRWEESMRLLISDGVDTFIEIGSGTVLAGLMKRIDRNVSVYSVRDSNSLEKTLAGLSVN